MTIFLSETFVLVSLLAVALLITLVGGLFVIITLCNDKDQSEACYDKRRRERAINQDR